MNRPVLAALVAACLAAWALSGSAQQRAYVPENLRTLSYGDQVRVISLEYEEQSGGRRIPDDQLRFYIDQVNRSNWGFNRIKADIGQSLGGSGPSTPGQTVRCESVNNQARICRVPWSGDSRLSRQLSSQPCIEGQTWQSQRGQVYVGRGCSAEFIAAAHTPAPLPGGTAIRCESEDGQSRICRVPWSGGSRLSRQLSSQPCIEGQTWQSQQGQVYVGRGCRAEFVAAAATRPNPPAGKTVVCTSTGNRPAGCPWPTGTGTPRLLEQLSSAACIKGQSWGFTGSAIWVSRNCSARFGY